MTPLYASILSCSSSFTHSTGLSCIGGNRTWLFLWWKDWEEVGIMKVNKVMINGRRVMQFSKVKKASGEEIEDEREQKGTKYRRVSGGNGEIW